MKKILLAVAALMLSATTFAQQKVVTETTVIGGDNYITHYLYNAQGNPILLLTDGLSQQLMTYNEQGQMTRQEYTDFTNANASRNYEYTYNALGQVATEEEFAGERSLGVTSYTYDEHGHITSLTNSRAGMPITRRNTYNEAGQLIKQETLHPMNPQIALSATEYVYDGDLLVQETDYSVDVLTSTTYYTYNNMSLRQTKVVKDADGAVTSTTTYAYADIDVSFTPQNVNAVANPGNTITVTWTGAANGIIVGGQYYAVSGQQFTTPVLLDGEYIVYVAYNGNAFVTEPLDVIDNTKVGVSNVQQTGDIYATNETIIDYYGNPKDVIAYNIPIQWTLPDGANPIGYRIYYNSTYYVDVDEGTIRAYTVPAINMKNYNPSTYSEVVLPLQIRVIAIYETGQVEPANTIDFTLEQTEAIMELVPLGIQRLSTLNPQPSTFYDLSGRRASANARGIVIQRQGDTVRKVLKR